MGVSFGFYAYYVPGQEVFANRIFTLLVQKCFEVASNDVLIAVPVFTFMGYIIDRANILDRMFHALQLAIGGMPGALAVVTMVVCALWGIASGIVGAVVVLMGLLALPAMLRAGYDHKLSAGVICAGGTLGILIPPSVMLILYGAIAGVSVVKLYAAAFIPGFGLTAAYIVYIVAIAVWKPSLAPMLPLEKRTAPLSIVLYELLVSFMPLTVLTIVVLGVIFFGLATPTELAAMGAAGALLMAVAYGADYSKRRNVLLLRVYAVLSAIYVLWLVGVLYFDLPAARWPLVAGAIVTGVVVFAMMHQNAFTLEKLKEFGLPYRPHRRHGVLAVCRIRHLLFDIRTARWTGVRRAIRAQPWSELAGLHAAGAGDHLPARLAAGVDRDHHHFRANLSAFARRLRDRSLVLRCHGGAQPPDIVPLAARRHGSVLSQGRRAAAGYDQRDIPRRDALHLDRGRLHGPHVRLPGHGALAAKVHVRLSRAKRAQPAHFGSVTRRTRAALGTAPSRTP